MLGSSIETKHLPIGKDLLDSFENISHLQHVLNIELDDEDVEHLLKHTVARIDKELNDLPRTDGSIYNTLHFNQVAVNAVFRFYYQLLRKYNKEDQYFHCYYLLDNSATDILNEKDCVIQYFVLLSAGDERFDQQALKDSCIRKFATAVDNNATFLLTIIKTLNLIFKKWPHLDVSHELSLEHVYFCLQSNQMGMRDEMMVLLKHVCACKETAYSYFAHIIRFWPWTNRSKLFMLGCILKKHNLGKLLHACGFCPTDFFDGIRSTLNYKNLLASSHYVVQALSSQSSPGLLALAFNIMENGSIEELRNFTAHWFARIQPTEVLFQMVQESSLLDDIKNNINTNRWSPLKCYRVVTVFSLFSKEIFQLCPQHFKGFCENLINACFLTEMDTQLLIFKLTIEHMANLPMDIHMDFLNAFLQTHMLVENSQFRNGMLGKVPTIINHFAKLYCRSCSKNNEQPDLALRILKFFQQLQSDVEVGIRSDVYQPKIFGLKLLDILIKSLYGNNIKKNAKNCSITQNQQLGEFLKSHHVFDSTGLINILMCILNDPTFDDALHLTVILIGANQPSDKTVNEAFEMADRCCTIGDVDVANLSCLYARVAVENCRNDSTVSEYFQKNLIDIKTKFLAFETDPLYACKIKGCHLFSSLNVLNEVMQLKTDICTNAFSDILVTIETIKISVLKMMNKCNIKDSSQVNAASFEDMDKSLEMLVSNSAYASIDNEGSRKYLLMTFWLTLKACCGLSASMVKILVASKEMKTLRVTYLTRCLQIIVDVLTKCRHKGANEAAGITIGTCTKYITSQFHVTSEEYGVIRRYLGNLYDAEGTEVSTTRRGAGFSIMFLHILKNEEHRNRPLLSDAIRHLLKSAKSPKGAISRSNCDRIEALHLHYLCVLVRDTELKDAVSNYNNEIMMNAISQIDNPEWTICNAALQLFGALVPKIVGQRQATELEETLPWDPSEITFCEVTRKLRMSFDYILKYCLSEKCSTRSIILFLEFLHKVEYIHKSSQPKSLEEFRELIWRLLRHHCEKVRILAAKCFVRSHEFSMELPQTLKNMASILFFVQNENFFQGLIQTLQDGIIKLQHDSKFVIPMLMQQEHLLQIKSILREHFTLKPHFKLYTLCKLWDMLNLLEMNNAYPDIRDKLRNMPLPTDDNLCIGKDLWLQRIHGK